MCLTSMSQEWRGWAAGAVALAVAACGGETSPTQPAARTFARVSAGGVHTCGVTSGGAGYCWGSNSVGQLGDGTTTNRSSPVPVGGGVSFAAVGAAGGAHTCGVTAGGVAYCWGCNSNGQLGDGTTTDRSTPVLVAGGVSFAAVSAGSYHTCGLTAAGAVYCWGVNITGQLGAGTTTTRLTPERGGSVAAVSGGNDDPCVRATA